MPVADGLLYHAINRGNNRGPIFFEASDYLTFLKALGQTQKRHPFRLFGYCLMTNHFHLSPETGQSISRILLPLVQLSGARDGPHRSFAKPFASLGHVRQAQAGLFHRYAELLQRHARWFQRHAELRQRHAVLLRRFAELLQRHAEWHRSQRQIETICLNLTDKGI
ncbi:MAG: transposase [Planctomycetes bacterium]|nr:transposase [Planctomycetota bacterium]